MRKHSLSLLSIAVFTLLTTNVSNAAMVYKCKNAQGKLLYQKTPCTEEAVSSWTPNTKVKLPIGLTFVVDTGATIVSLPRAFAASASLFCNDKAVIETANGQSNVCTSTITELKLGNFVFKNVTALIVPNLAQPLLGMNVLQGFNIEQKNEEMRLSEQDAKAP
ncbi:MAG: retroviral-like aspartic protease family protein [Methylococcaceae bacterium]|nr:retroviral-like aspartic protease family protein [Methylococcaceae bacterium]